MRERLVCPRHHRSVEEVAEHVRCACGCCYPLVDGIPIMLLDEVRPTHVAITKSLEQARSPSSTGRIGEQQRQSPEGAVHDVVQQVVAATCGYLYKPLIGNLKRFPIPHLRLPHGDGKLLLDIGCNWGRWSIAAARIGYRPVGIDPDLGAIRTAQQIARSAGVTAEFIVADARYLPFHTDSIDMVFSYSVLQHFSKEDVHACLHEVARVLKRAGSSLIQMPNGLGIRSLYHQIRRGFRQARNFEVRYWTPGELRKRFTSAIGPTSLSVDGFFGLGIQASDLDLLPAKHKVVVRCSELMRKLSRYVPGLSKFADSLYVTSDKAGPPA